jgi:hypothetical protein
LRKTPRAFFAKLCGVAEAMLNYGWNTSAVFHGLTAWVANGARFAGIRIALINRGLALLASKGFAGCYKFCHGFSFRLKHVAKIASFKKHGQNTDCEE